MGAFSLINVLCFQILMIGDNFVTLPYRHGIRYEIDHSHIILFAAQAQEQAQGRLCAQAQIPHLV